MYILIFLNNLKNKFIHTQQIYLSITYVKLTFQIKIKY